jgi:AraC-like DNA-binding protein
MLKTNPRCSTVDIAGPVEVLRAKFTGRAFSPHWHEEFAIGLIDAGIERFEYQGATHVAGQGDIVLLNAGDVHTGESFDERGFGFRMLYVPKNSLQEVAAANRDTAESLHFTKAVLRSPVATEQLLAAHRSHEHGRSKLQIESLFITAIAGVLDQSSSSFTPVASEKAPSAILSAKDYLLDHLFEEVPLERLASLAGLSKYHFLRMFRLRFGLPPHAYQLQQRIFHAKTLLQALPPIVVAQQCGFADQSHFHRVFRALVGSAPGTYAQQFRSRPKV